MDHIGIMSQCEKVLKLWDGLSPGMRYELKRAWVSKEVHSWRRIVHKAELIELAGFEKDSSPCFAPKQSDRPRDEIISINEIRMVISDSVTIIAQPSTSALPSSSAPRNSARSDNSVHHYKNDYQSGQGRPQTNHDRTSRTTRKPDLDGNCYKCGQPGHFAQNCPSNNIVHSRNNGPPGISARGMQFPLHDESSEMLAQLVETTEQPGVLTLNMMHFTSFVDDVSEDSAFEYMSENNNSLTPISNADSVLEDGLLPLPSNLSCSEIPDNNHDSLPDLESVSDSDIEADDIPDLQDVSDSEYDDDDMFDSLSTFEIDLLESNLWPQCSDSNPEGEESIDLESDSETLYQTEISSETSTMSGNESDSISESNNTPEFSFADDAEEVFGYLTTNWSDFFLHKTLEPGWWPRAIDDWMCLALTFVLNHDAPYPFDFMLWGAQGSYRFHVRNLDDGNYGITDENAPYNELTLPAQLLNDTAFMPGAWYAEQQTNLLNYSFDAGHWQDISTDLGDVYMQGMKFVLTCGIPAYPKSAFTALYDPFERFVIYKTSGDDKDACWMVVQTAD
ncbi:hypothetical protein EV368DRAFT_88303 [Lentinula lateritia]|nr:hypothetical protein EV368DRAFT_88303 [Lentinula lateritia]